MQTLMNILKQRARDLKFLVALSLVSVTGAYPEIYAQDAAEPAPETAVPAPRGQGRIEGRVYVPTLDRFLENVRVTMEGTDKVSITDDTGTYFFDNVPAGSVKLTANFTGFDPQSRTVTVVAGAVASADIDLMTAPQKTVGKDDVVMMGKFVVVGNRETLGAAIADNEQRESITMKTVVSTDEFGMNPTGNIGDFLKNLPGVEVDADEGGESRWATLGGAGGSYVPVTLGGFDFASAASEGITDRRVQMQQFGMNNVARLSVSWAPTPQTPADALAGTIDMVPRKAFESKKPKFEFSTYLIMPERSFTLGRTPGPLYEESKKVKPSWKFNYTNPVSKNFGFTVSGGYSFSSSVDFVNGYTWRGISSGYGTFSGETYPAPSSNYANPYSAPYISNYTFSVGDGYGERSTAAITADWRLGRNHRFSAGVQYAYYNNVFSTRGRQFTLNSIQATDLDLLTMEHVEGNGYIRASASARRKRVTTWMPTLTYNYIGSVWKADAGIGISLSDLTYTDTDDGFFRTVQADRGAVRIVIDKYLSEKIPHNIKTYVAGLPMTPENEVDYHSMNEMVITQAVTRPAQNSSEARTYYANAERAMRIFGAPALIKAGVNVKHRITDQNNQNYNYQFLGADGIYPANSSYDRPNNTTTPATSDNEAAGFQETVPYTMAGKLTGLGDFEFLNNAMVYNIFTAHPSYFKRQESTSGLTASRHAEEVIAAGFLQGDIKLLNNKLIIVTGVRFEQTHAQGDGPLYTAETGYIVRGAHKSATYNGWYPSVNAQYKWGSKDQWIFRGSWFKTIGRPNYDIYNGGITLPTVGSDPFSNYISMPNPELKPWTAHTWRGDLSYYFTKRGYLSLVALTREYTNQHVNLLTPLTDDLRVKYGIGTMYDGYFVSTRTNSPYKFTYNELTFSYSQALVFLPSWAQGLSVRASVTWRTKSGREAYRQTGLAYVPRSYKASLSYNRGRVNANVNWGYRDRYVTNIFETDNYVEPGTRTYARRRLTMDIKTKIKITRSIFITAQVDNPFDQPYAEYEVVSPSTPGGAVMSSIRSNGPTYTFGIEGNF